VRKELQDKADITTGKEIPIITEHNAWWALYPGRTPWRKEKSLPLRGIEPPFPGHPAHTHYLY